MPSQLLTKVSETGADFIKFQLYDPYTDIEELPAVSYPTEIKSQIHADKTAIANAMLQLDWLPELYSLAGEKRLT